MATRTRAAATASEGVAAEAAASLLAKGNAVDAVVGGVFAAAAAGPSVLLGPVQILFGGAGLGLRAVDGRVRQAGKGVPRPRGFTVDQAVSPAARVGVPTLPAGLAAALASSGALTLAQVMAPALATADAVRKDVLRRIAQRGASALASDAIGAELVAACGRVAGGLLTRDDLDAVLPTIVPTEERRLAGGARVAAFAPWRAEAIAAREDSGLSAAAVHVVAAADHRGLLAVACYERPDDGVPIEALGLVAPLVAAPVLRGQPRVRPGIPVPASAPMALGRSAAATAFDAIVAIALDHGGEGALGLALDTWSNDADVLSPPHYAGPGALLGIQRTSDGATLFTKRG
jgi:gamma-glutamyltranspeptidase/glutathione hydrolase